MKEAEISVGGSIVAVADTGDCYGPDEQPELMLGRGYTGHEHLPWFGLINMNARLYDPAVHRFLSPDPEVQLPGVDEFIKKRENPLKFRYGYAF